MVRAELSVRKFGRGGRAFAPEFRSASPPPHRGFDPARPLLCGETSARRTGNRRAFDRNPSRAPGFCSEISVDHRDFKPKLRRGATETSAPDGAALHRGSGRVAPEAARHARRRSARSPPPSAGTPAADHAAALWQLCCRIGHTTTVACQVVGSRSSCLPPPANGHGRGALCERRNGTASAQWAPRLPGQPASRLHLQALVRAAFDHFDPDRRGLWVRHADTHAQANTYRPRAHPGRMSAHAAAAVAQSCALEPKLEPKFRSRRAEVSA